MMPVGDEFAKELAKQLPIRAMYDDAAAPAAKQVGQFGQDLVKVLQLALAPVQYVAALQDRYRRFLDTSVRRVPERRRIAPAPQILGPVMEGVRYEAEGTPIDEMFSQLLSCAMDSQRVDRAHPAYPIIIRQLSADEAKVLERIHSAKEPFKYVQLHFHHGGRSYAGPIEVDEFPRDGLTFPTNVGFYMNHLYQLGLAGVFETRQDPTFEDDPVRRQTGVRMFSQYRLMDVGVKFVEACQPPTTGL